MSGARGSYSLTLLETPSETLKSFQNKAHINAEKKLPLDLRESSLFDSYASSSSDLSNHPTQHNADGGGDGNDLVSSTKSYTHSMGTRSVSDSENQLSVLEKRVRRFWKTIGPNMEPPVYGADASGTLFGGLIIAL